MSNKYLIIFTAEPNCKPAQKRLTHRQRALERDEHTFGTPIDQSLNQDFDFEKNLALFNKEVCIKISIFCK